MTGNDWRAAQAAALEAEAFAIAAALDELDNAHAVLETRGRDGLCHEVRGLAAGLRSELSAMNAQARALRAPADPEPVMPIALTTRHVRGADR